MNPSLNENNSNFAGERIEAIYLPIDDVENWSVVQTQNSYYEIRVGGFKELHVFDSTRYEKTRCPKIGEMVVSVWTDEESVYLELADRSFIIIGFLDVQADGTLNASVNYLNTDDFDESERDFNANPVMKKIR